MEGGAGLDSIPRSELTSATPDEASSNSKLPVDRTPHSQPISVNSEQGGAFGGAGLPDEVSAQVASFYNHELQYNQARRVQST